MRSFSLREFRPSTRFSVLAFLCAAGGLAACGTIEPVAPHEAPITDPTQLYMRLTLNHAAVNLSTAPSYNTQQLTATPRDALSAEMSGLPAPTFSSRDTTKVKVTADGLMTAVAATTGSPVEVIASLTVGRVTHTDTAWVTVITSGSPPVLASLSIDPVLPDSGRWPLEWDTSPNQLAVSGILFLLAGYYGQFGIDLTTIFEPRLVPEAEDPGGTPIPGLEFEYASLDPAVATVDRRTGIATLHHPGQARLVARTMAYGIAKADTATFTVTWPSNRTIDIGPGPSGVLSFQPSEIRIRSSGVVLWQTRQKGDTVDVTFDDLTNVVAAPTAVCDGVPVLGFFFPLDPRSSCGADESILLPGLPADTDNTAFLIGGARQFPVPGVYHYHSVRTGATGRIVVTDDPT